MGNSLKTEGYHNFDEGDCGHPIDRKGKHLCFFKKGYWKRRDRKKFIKNFLKQKNNDDKGME